MNNGSPSRLYESCLNFICQNLDLLCELLDLKEAAQNSTKKSKKLVFRDQNIRFNHIVSEDILERLCDLGKLNDLTISLFIGVQTCFKNVRIKNAYISKESVKLLLRQHQIDELFINNIQINSNDSDLVHVTKDFENGIINNFGSHTPITINDLIDGIKLGFFIFNFKRFLFQKY